MHTVVEVGVVVVVVEVVVAVVEVVVEVGLIRETVAQKNELECAGNPCSQV